MTRGAQNESCTRQRSGGGYTCSSTSRTSMRSTAIRAGALALVAAACAVASVFGGTDIGREWQPNPDTASAQASNPRLAAASCGSTSPLHGRTRAIVDKIMDKVKDLDGNQLNPPLKAGKSRTADAEYKTLTAIAPVADCSAVTDDQYLARIGISYRGTDDTASPPAFLTGDIYPSPDPDLERVLDLDLDDLGMTQIRSEDFAGLTGMQWLSMGHNDLTTIPVDAFSDLSGLTRLYLTHNKLTSIPVGAFNGLGNLEELSIGGNELTTLPVGVFNGLSNLKTLNLGGATHSGELVGGRGHREETGNRFNSLPSGLLDGLDELRTLNVSQNQLTSDGLGFLSTPLMKLTTLNLRWNQLTSDKSGPDIDLPSDIFSKHTKLEILTLNGNRIKVFPDDVFSGMVNLRTLNISHYVHTTGGQSLTTLQDGLFDGLSKLDTIYVHSTARLTSVGADVFSTLAGLQGCETTETPPQPIDCIQRIHFGPGKLTTLPDGLFAGMPSLQSVFIYDGNLTSIPAGTFTGSTGIGLVYLAYNRRLTELPAGLFTGMTKLNSLYLNDNQLTSIPEGLFSFLDDKTGPFTVNDNRFYVNLNGNSLTTLPAGIFRSSVYVYYVLLADNNISSLPATVFDGLTNLRGLDLCGNSIPASDITALEARMPRINDLTTGDCPDTTITRRVPTFTETEPRASCGAGHTLTGRTKVVVYSMMRNAWQGPARWKTLVDAIAADGLTAAPGLWPSSTIWNNRYPTRTDDPAFCGLMTGTDLARVNTITVPGYIESLTSRDFAGLIALNDLQLNNQSLHSLPSGLFDGLTNLRNLDLQDNFLSSLPAGIFDDLVNLRHLNLNDNRLTSLPPGVFDGLRNVRFLNLEGNMLQTLPAEPFRNMGELRELFINNNQLTTDAVPPRTFAGLNKLRVLHLNDNKFNSLPVGRFADSGMDLLRRLDIAEYTDFPSEHEFATFRQHLPSLIELTFRTGSLLIEGTPTPTPTFTPTLTFNERIGLAFVSHIAPSVRELTVGVGSTVNLSFQLYNLQSTRDDELSTNDELRITWSAAGGAGTFTEPSGAHGVDGDGAVNDRVVAWRAPSEPGNHTVTAGFARDYVCKGDESECTAVFNITVVRSAAAEVTEPTPCSTPGLIPTSLTDTAGNAYAVITPAEGGEFTGDGITVSAGAGTLEGCGIIGVRAESLAGPMTASHPGWTTAGNRYRLTVTNSQGNPLTTYTTRNPLSACLPLPDSLRADISGVALLRERADGSTQVASSRVRVGTDDGITICGAVSELPAIVVAASRAIPQPQPTPTAVVQPTTPDTGGTAPSSVAYVLLALVLGVLAVAAAVRLIDSATARP